MEREEEHGRPPFSLLVSNDFPHSARRNAHPAMISTACTEHCGSLQTGGYGQIRHEGRNWLAHRLAWTLTYGPIPDGLNVLHRCDNPRCVNVGHLFLGTAGDNLRVRKLTDADVQAIRQSHQPLKTIAERYGISVAHACNVRSGKRKGLVAR